MVWNICFISYFYVQTSILPPECVPRLDSNVLTTVTTEIQASEPSTICEGEFSSTKRGISNRISDVVIENNISRLQNYSRRETRSMHGPDVTQNNIILIKDNISQCSRVHNFLNHFKYIL